MYFKHFSNVNLDLEKYFPQKKCNIETYKMFIVTAVLHTTTRMVIIYVRKSMFKNYFLQQNCDVKYFKSIHYSKWVLNAK